MIDKVKKAVHGVFVMLKLEYGAISWNPCTPNNIDAFDYFKEVQVHFP